MGSTDMNSKSFGETVEPLTYETVSDNVVTVPDVSSWGEITLYLSDQPSLNPPISNPLNFSSR